MISKNFYDIILTGDFSMSDNMFLIENGVLKGFNSVVSKDEKIK